MSKTFKAKVDTWLIVVMAVVFAMALYATWSAPHSVGGLIVLWLCIVLICVMTFNFKYEITDNQLIVHAGFFKSKVDISTISKVEKTNTIVSSPAPSLDRIRVSYNKFDDIVISPKDKEGFIEALKSVNPQIEVKI